MNCSLKINFHLKETFGVKIWGNYNVLSELLSNMKNEFCDKKRLGEWYSGEKQIKFTHKRLELDTKKS